MKTVTALLCALLLALTACAAPPAEQPPSEEAPETVQCIAMDTFMAFTACGPEAGETVQAAADRVAALE